MQKELHIQKKGTLQVIFRKITERRHSIVAQFCSYVGGPQVVFQSIYC